MDLAQELMGEVAFYTQGTFYFGGGGELDIRNGNYFGSQVEQAAESQPLGEQGDDDGLPEELKARRRRLEEFFCGLVLVMFVVTQIHRKN